MVPEDLDVLEEETEEHRIAKATRAIVGREAPFEHARVRVVLPQAAVRTPIGQWMVVMTVNQLLRFKSVVGAVTVDADMTVPVLPGVPGTGGSLGELLVNLEASLCGPKSRYVIPLRFEHGADGRADVSLGLMQPCSGEARSAWVDADSWTGFIGRSAPGPAHGSPLPFGAYLAASMGVAEVFKHLLFLNFGDELQRPVTLSAPASLCALNCEVGTLPAYPALPESVDLGSVVLAGAGAGGTAALYALASMPSLTGEIEVIDPERFGPSNLGRYLTTTYDDVHNAKPKAPHAVEWMASAGSGLKCRPHSCDYGGFSALRAGRVDADFLFSTVDTAEARREIQLSTRAVIGDAGVADGLYTVVMAYAGRGYCLICKHPPDADSNLKRAARQWGQTLATVKEWSAGHHTITEEDVRRLARVQGRTYETLAPDTLGQDFDNLYRLLACGAASFSLDLPNQNPTLPGRFNSRVRERTSSRDPAANESKER